MKSYRLLTIAVFTAIAAISCHQKELNKSTGSASLLQTSTSSVLLKRNHSLTTATTNAAKTKPKRLLTSNLDDIKTDEIDNQPIKIEDKSYQDSEPVTLESIYAEFDAPTQVFEINNQEEITINCKQGTRITIPQGAFEIPNNNENSTVSLHVQEYYGKEALLMGNLGTVSNNQLIESAGTINIEAFVDGKKIDLKKDKSIDLGFPDKTKNEKKGMELFEGKKDKKGNINWQNGVGSAIGYQPSGYMNKNNSYKKWATPKRSYKTFNNVLQSKYSKKLKESFRKIKLITDFTFTVDYKGNLLSVESQDELPEEIKSALFPILESLNKWDIHDNQILSNKKRKLKTINTDNLTETISIKFRNRRIKIVSQPQKSYLNYSWYGKIKEKNNNNINNQPTDSTKMGTMEYAFSSNKLGWINCDRFISSGKPLVNVPLVTNAKDIDTDYKLVLKKINSIMPAYIKGTKLEFVNIPEGYEGTVLAIKIEDNKILAGTKDIIAGEPVGKIEMKEYSKQEIKELISQLGT